MEVLEVIQEIIKQHEVSITYDVIDQIENGREEAVASGDIPKYTFTIYITDLRLGDWVSSESYDNLSEGLLCGVQIAKDYIKNIRPEA